MSELDVLTHRALGWINSYIEYFDPSQATSEATRELRMKTLSELALLVICLDRDVRFKADSKFISILKSLSIAVTSSGLLDRLFRFKEGLVGYAIPLVALRKCGCLSDADWSRVDQFLKQHRWPTVAERLPFRTMELRYILDLCDGFPPHCTLSQGSILSTEPNRIWLSDMDAYSITHALFYLTDFGLSPNFPLDARGKKRIGECIEDLLGIYLACANLDLVAELLLSCHCARMTDSKFYELGWTALVAAQTVDGAVPGPNFDPEKAAAKPESDDRSYIFEHSYHTTLVAALAGVCCPPPLSH